MNTNTILLLTGVVVLVTTVYGVLAMTYQSGYHAGLFEARETIEDMKEKINELSAKVRS